MRHDDPNRHPRAERAEAAGLAAPSAEEGCEMSVAAYRLAPPPCVLTSQPPHGGIQVFDLNGALLSSTTGNLGEAADAAVRASVRLESLNQEELVWARTSYLVALYSVRVTGFVYEVGDPAGEFAETFAAPVAMFDPATCETEKGAA